jgi:hypothetical protein
VPRIPRPIPNPTPPVYKGRAYCTVRTTSVVQTCCYACCSCPGQQAAADMNTRECRPSEERPLHRRSIPPVPRVSLVRGKHGTRSTTSLSWFFLRRETWFPRRDSRFRSKENAAKKKHAQGLPKGQSAELLYVRPQHVGMGLWGMVQAHYKSRQNLSLLRATW